MRNLALVSPKRKKKSNIRGQIRSENKSSSRQRVSLLLVSFFLNVYARSLREPCFFFSSLNSARRAFCVRVSASKRVFISRKVFLILYKIHRTCSMKFTKIVFKLFYINTTYKHGCLLENV